MADTTEYTGPSNLGVTRWNAQIEVYYKGASTEPSYRPTMTPDIVGRYVLARDYAALAAKLAEVEAKLAQGIVAEFDDGSRICLSAFAGGASKGGAWSHLTLMKEEQDGSVSYRHYTADGDWCSSLFFPDLAELKGENQ